MLETNQLSQLITVADTKTLSKAAEILHISQPALTRSIQKLESELNVTLFDRQKNKITLNKTGEHLPTDSFLPHTCRCRADDSVHTGI